jgi:hypothetical protein
MKLTRCLVVLCLLNGGVGSLQAAAPLPSDFTQAISQLSTDSRLVSQWFSDQLSQAVPFNATTGNVVPQQLKVFGVEVGVEGIVSGTQVNINGLRALPTTIVNTHEIDSFDRLPMPGVLGHAKVGLPFGIDAGLRLGGIPAKSINKDDSKISFENKIFGLDLRKKIIEEGLGKPGVTLGVNFTRVKGYIDATTTYSSKLGNTVVGTSNFESRLNAVGTGRSDWDMNSYGIQTIVNKKILFMNPYLGASVNRNSGSVTTSITTAGTITLDDGLGNSASQAVTTAPGVGSAKANKWDLRGLAGVEFSILPFVKLGLQGEYAGAKNIGAALGLRVQFR